MKYTSNKLLKLAINNKHIGNCPSIVPVTECICWITQVSKWNKNKIIADKNRVRTNRKYKVHYSNAKCSVINRQNHISSSLVEVSCEQCLKNVARQRF